MLDKLSKDSQERIKSKTKKVLGMIGQSDLADYYQLTEAFYISLYKKHYNTTRSPTYYELLDFLYDKNNLEKEKNMEFVDNVEEKVLNKREVITTDQLTKMILDVVDDYRYLGASFTSYMITSNLREENPDVEISSREVRACLDGLDFHNYSSDFVDLSNDDGKVVNCKVWYNTKCPKNLQLDEGWYQCDSLEDNSCCCDCCEEGCCDDYAEEPLTLKDLLDLSDFQDAVGLFQDALFNKKEEVKAFVDQRKVGLKSKLLNSFDAVLKTLLAK